MYWTVYCSYAHVHPKALWGHEATPECQTGNNVAGAHSSHRSRRASPCRQSPHLSRTRGPTFRGAEGSPSSGGAAETPI